MRTEELIRSIAADAKPLRRLASPLHRLVLWLVPTLAVSATIVYMMGLRLDIGQKMQETKFLVELAATTATGILAGLAALCSGYPGRPLWERAAPLPPLALWLGSLGEGCWQSIVRRSEDGTLLMPDLICFPAILLVGTVPALLLFWMVRRAAPIAPVTTMALTALAASAIGAAALRLFHPQDASLMVLVWQFGSVALLTLMASLFGRRLLRWPEALVAKTK